MLIFIEGFTFDAARFVSIGLSRVDDRPDSEKKEDPNKPIDDCPLFIQLFIKVTDTNTTRISFKQDEAGPIDLIDTYLKVLCQMELHQELVGDSHQVQPKGYRDKLCKIFKIPVTKT